MSAQDSNTRGAWSALLGAGRALLRGVRRSGPAEPPFREFRNRAEFLRYQQDRAAEYRSRARIEAGAVRDAERYSLPGYCEPCGRGVDFLVDYQYAYPVDGRLVPNWRERLACPCGLNSRMRGALHAFRRYCRPKPDDPIYITEQVTPLYRWLAQTYTNLAGSEYLGDAIPFGRLREDGVRNESVTRLSFADGVFSAMLSFDVFEHVPHYERALVESARVLRPGGHLLFTVPFMPAFERTLIRARVAADGSIEHLESPEYHGDPLVSDGCLCFYHFGWDLLEACRRAGFADVSVIAVWSLEFGYLGGDLLLFLARK